MKACRGEESAKAQGEAKRRAGKVRKAEKMQTRGMKQVNADEKGAVTSEPETSVATEDDGADRKGRGRKGSAGC